MPERALRIAMKWRYRARLLDDMAKHADIGHLRVSDCSASRLFSNSPDYGRRAAGSIPRREHMLKRSARTWLGNYPEKVSFDHTLLLCLAARGNSAMVRGGV